MNDTSLLIQRLENQRNDLGKNWRKCKGQHNLPLEDYYIR